MTDTAARSPADHPYLDRSITALVFQLSRHLALTLDRRTAPFNLTGPQAALLLRTCAAPGATPTQLASTLGIDNAGTTRLLDRLEGKGLIARHTSPTDRRVVIIEPTPDGKALAPHLLPIVRGVTVQLLEGLAPEELPALHTLLLRLLENVESHAELDDGTADCPPEGEHA